MAFVPLPLLKAAAEALEGRHPLAVVVIPAMVKAGVEVLGDSYDGTEFGSLNEVDLLKAYFHVPGGPPNRPFRAIWESNQADRWRDARYPGRALQRIRTDRVKSGQGFYQRKAEEGRVDKWAFRPNAGPELHAVINHSVRVVDLAIWYGREQDVVDLDALVGWFLKAFPLDRAGLIGTVYDESVPDHYRDIPFSPTPLSQTEYAEALGGAPEPPKIEGSLEDFAAALESEVIDRGFVTSPGLVSRVVGAWARGDIVVLVGQPGTGKTRFANTIEEALRAVLGDLHAEWISIRADFDEGDLIGYERLDGVPELRPFTVDVLQSEDPLAPHLVVFEEFNLASLEAYLAAVLVATQDPERRVPVPGVGDLRLPIDTLFLATCNSYLDEPESRHRLSFPSKARANIITMPNVLLERYQAEGEEAIIELTIDMAAQEGVRVNQRQQTGLGTTLDSARASALAGLVAADLSPAVRDRWISISKWLLESPEGRTSLRCGSSVM